MLEQRSAALDEMHVGDITGALGTIAQNDVGPRVGWRAKIMTFFAILGPGLIVMVGDNDAGAFSTYTQAGQDYGTRLLWTLLLLIPVLYVNQEMVLRLGVVTGVGHARLILERFGAFWGVFSVLDLFVLNALTIVTEFIGISLALNYLGLPQLAGIVVAAACVMLAAAQGNFRRVERFSVALCFGSLALVPILVVAHGPLGPAAHDFFVPGLPKGDLSAIMLAIIAIVGTTIAPWQLFFQQSYVIDKRITPRFLNYERLDLAAGIVFVVLGAVAMMVFTATAFAGHKEFGDFQDAGRVAAGIGTYVGHWAGVLFSIGLIDASIIGASSVSLSTAYAVGDILGMKHSLHRSAGDAVGFYAFYGLLIAVAAIIVIIPGSPLGLLTNAVQVLAGILLPSATVFLLLLSNDRALLGPWTNTNRTNVFTGIVVAVLVMLSMILTAAVVYPAIGTRQIVWILGAGTLLALGIGAWMMLRSEANAGTRPDRSQRATWRMPPLEERSHVPQPFLANRATRVFARRGDAVRRPHRANRAAALKSYILRQ
jgi:NRAMP (natural resistance-associated macrophage protein)-like metal ion transporter